MLGQGLRRSKGQRQRIGTQSTQAVQPVGQPGAGTGPTAGSPSAGTRSDRHDRDASRSWASSGTASIAVAASVDAAASQAVAAPGGRAGRPGHADLALGVWWISSPSARTPARRKGCTGSVVSVSQRRQRPS